MGKKGGKKGKVNNAVENAEPHLPTIPEEDVLEKKDSATKLTEKANEQSKIDLKETEQQNSSKSAVPESDEETKISGDAMEIEKNANEEELKDSEKVEEIPIVTNEQDLSKTKITEKKGKKRKSALNEKEIENTENEEQKGASKKSKKYKKGKSKEKDSAGDQVENKDDEINEDATKTEPEKEKLANQDEMSKETPKASKSKKKGKKDKISEEGKENEEEVKSKSKKNKKAKKEEIGEAEEKKPTKSQSNIKTKHQSGLAIQKKESKEASTETSADLKPNKKSKKEKKEGYDEGTAKSASDHTAQKRQSILKRRKSKQPKSKVSISSDLGSRDSEYSDEEEQKTFRRSTKQGSLFFSSSQEAKINMSKTRQSTSGYRSSSRLGVVSSSESSINMNEDDTKDGSAKKGRVKKRKKDKKEKQDEEEETEEEKERKKLEKLEQKKALKEANKAARKEAAAKKKAEKMDKKDDLDNLLKRIDDLKNIGKEMGITEISEVLDQDEGPKKKMSKKEKAKQAAEFAEKAKAELEAQAKKLEELVKKKKEEERLAAIEMDKKDTLEQGLRMEQLHETNELLEDIEETSAEITKEENKLLEWKNYVECRELPNPAMYNEMNTYLHLWDLNLENTRIEDLSKRTADAIKLLDELDELIETITPENITKLENWKWVRQLFREYQTASLDVATYRLMRNVEHNLHRINIPTADFNFKDDYVTLSLWLRVILPIPLPNPRRPPKPRVDISFGDMDVSALFPAIIDCENAAIRGMYLKYDHLSDLCKTFNMSEVPEDYYMDLLSIMKKEWHTKLRYKYDNRDIVPETVVEQPVEQENESPNETPDSTPEKSNEERPTEDEEKKINIVEHMDLKPDEDIPIVPFKQLNPTASDYALSMEDKLYDDSRQNLKIEVPENVINLRKFVILGGVFHLNLLAQPPQPQDFVTMEMTITTLYLPKKLEVLPFKVVYTPYIPPEPEPTDSDTSVRKLPEELEEEIKKQEEELDKLIFINIKWPPHVIFLELPIVCRWDDEKKQWSNEEIYDIKHNEDKCMLSFRTGVFGVYGLATYKYCNLPFQAYDIKPEADGSVTVQLTAAILMLEFNVKEGLIAITQLQNSPNQSLQDQVGQYMKLHRLKKIMKDTGIDIFPAFDAFCYVDGCCEKQWAMEQHLYYNMALISNCFNFSWSRWNLQAGRRKIVLQMRNYVPEMGKQKNHQMLLVTPLKATFIDCTEVSPTFSEKEVESLRFCADLYHLMKTTSGIFVRNKVGTANKQNVYTLAQFLVSIRVLSFS